MALYSDPQLVRRNAPAEFDIVYSPGEGAPYDGVYGCQTCHAETLAKKDESLPPHKTQTNHTARWHMVVYAETTHSKKGLPTPGPKPKSKKSAGAKKKI